MSQLLISLSQDLKRLQDEGYSVKVKGNYLLIENVPYVDHNKEVKEGILVSELSLAGDMTIKPSTHVAHFIGDHPCDKDGRIITKIINASNNKCICDDIIINHTFSSKPEGGYNDFYDKMTTYIKIISNPACSIDSNSTAKKFKVIESDEEGSVFKYIDTASSRAGINMVTKKLEHEKVGIVGLGGTGSYVLDLVAKTSVKEIRIFDGDKFSQHNAFRSPGAPSIEELREELQKVAYFEKSYSKIHRYIVANNFFIDDSNVDQLQGLTFVFLCLDRGEAKKLIVKKLEEYNISFIDVGIGVYLIDESLSGILRITTSTIEKREHVHNKNRIPYSDGGANNDYSRNIQIAELNALNAALAVVKWKKLLGFYLDLDKEHHSLYTINGNVLINEDM